MRQGLDGYRFNHVKSVYEECSRLSGMFSLAEEESDVLLKAAILHDISKPFDKGNQQELAEGLGIVLGGDDAASYKTLHAITGAELARKCYPDIVTTEVYECIRWHCTGKEDMNLPEKLLYLADYIEPTRKFDDCIRLREYFYSLTDQGVAAGKALDRAMLMSFDMTVRQLIDDGENIHPSTVKARNYMLNILKHGDII